MFHDVQECYTTTQNPWDYQYYTVSEIQRILDPLPPFYQQINT